MENKTLLKNTTYGIIAFSLFMTAYILRFECSPSLGNRQIQVIVNCRGAAIEVIDEGIVAPLYDKISTVKGVEYTKATANVGSANFVLSIGRKCNIQDLKSEILEAFDSIRFLPPGTERPKIKETKDIKDAVQVAIYGDVSGETLKAIAVELQSILTKHESITSISRHGDLISTYHVYLIPYKLAKYNLSPINIVEQVKDYSNKYITSAGNNQFFSVEVSSKVDTIKNLESLPISVAHNSSICLSEIADVTRTFKTYEDVDCFFNGKPAIILVIGQNNASSPLAVATDVKNCVREYKKTIRNDLEIEIFHNSILYLYQEIRSVLKSLGCSILCIWIVISIFMSFKIALLLALSLIFCIAGTLSLFPILNMSINFYSLFAFTLAMGLVVDDSIVISENILVHIEKNKKPLSNMAFKKAILNGTIEVFPAILCATLSSLVVYIPFCFKNDSMIGMFKILYTCIVVILAVSIIEALILLPAHIYHFNIKPKRKKISRFTNYLKTIYKKFLLLCFKRKYVVLLVYVISLILCFQLAGLGFFDSHSAQQTNTMYLKVNVETTPFFPENNVINMVKDISYQINDILQEINDSELTDFKKDWEYASKRFNPQKANFEISLCAAFNQELLEKHWILSEATKAKLEKNEFIDYFYLNENDQPTDRVVLNITGRNKKYITACTKMIYNRVIELPWVVSIKNNTHSLNNKVKLKLNNSARYRGISESKLSEQVKLYTEETIYFTKFDDDKFKTNIVITSSPTESRTIEELINFHIKTNHEKSDTVENCFDIGLEKAPVAFDRVGGQISNTLLIRFDEDHVKYGTAVNVIEAISCEVRKELDLDSEQDNRIVQDERGLSQLGLAKKTLVLFLVTFLLLYSILSVTFNNYRLPFLVFVPLPFAIVGVLFGHKFFGIEVTTLSIFGIVAMSGVALNDSVLLIRKIISKVETGVALNYVELVVTACEDRLRPILLTTITTFLGIMPFLIQGVTPKNILIMPVTISLAFGILFSTLAVLVVVPVCYLTFNKYKPQKN